MEKYHWCISGFDVYHMAIGTGHVIEISVFYMLNHRAEALFAIVEVIVSF